MRQQERLNLNDIAYYVQHATYFSQEARCSASGFSNIKKNPKS